MFSLRMIIESVFRNRSVELDAGQEISVRRDEPTFK